MYYNTTNEKELLCEFVNKAKTQNDEVLAIYKKHKMISPATCWIIFGKDRAPLTSIRRSINTLTNMGYLEKCETKVTGIYGRKEYQWRRKQ